MRCVVGCCHGEGLCDMWLVVVLEENLALSADQCQLQALQFSVYLINLLSLLLRCNGFAGIQKTSGSDRQQTKQAVTVIFFFFSASLTLGSALELLLGPTTELVITGCHIKSTFCCTIRLRNVSLLLCRIGEEDTSKGWLFFDFQAAHEALTCRGFFTFPICFKCRMTI